MSTPSLSSAPTISPSPAIPVLLLKTQSQPHDSYHDYFSTSPSAQPPGDNENVSSSPSSSSATVTTVTNTPRFQPLFVPVLEHHPNTRNLDMLQDLLRSEQLGQKYGGMIFTSQRAVEAWTEVVKRVEGLQGTREDGISSRTGKVCSCFSLPFAFFGISRRVAS
jgi:uroporphyrinogen-III synthase